MEDEDKFVDLASASGSVFRAIALLHPALRTFLLRRVGRCVLSL